MCLKTLYGRSATSLAARCLPLLRFPAFPPQRPSRPLLPIVPVSCSRPHPRCRCVIKQAGEEVAGPSDLRSCPYVGGEVVLDGDPYAFGVDPAWRGTKTELPYLNRWGKGGGGRRARGGGAGRGEAGREPGEAERMGRGGTKTELPYLNRWGRGGKIGRGGVQEARGQGGGQGRQARGRRSGQAGTAREEDRSKETGFKALKAPALAGW